MLRNSELDRLKAEQQSLFEQKQVAFQKFKDLQEQTNTAHDAMQSAWDERVSTRERMNAEFEARQSAYSHRNLVWDEYGRIRDYNNSRIESLKYEADAEHRAMQDCFERASDAYQYGDKSEAPYYSQEGHAHKDRRDELNAEISELAREVKQAKANAEALAPRIDSSAFNYAKSAFESAKARHESAQAEFKRLKGRRDSAKSEFDQLQTRFKQAQDAFNRKLEEVKANRRRERDEVLDKAGVRYSERKDAKIVKKSDGTTQVYHGGIGSGDGYGHGHTALDQFGRKTYERGAFEEHGEQNFTDDGKNTCKTLAVGTDLFDGKPAKVRSRKDGKTDIFFVDSGNYGDGLGHGHVVLDKDGSTIYLRDKWQDKKQGQYLIDDTKNPHTKI